MSRVEPPGGFLAPALAGEAVVAVAVSGGGDSTALLLALRDAFSPAGPRLLALTVDHGLRPDSADEARVVAALCAEIGVAHRILRWTGPIPAAGLADAARLARHRLMAQAARDAGARIVLTGHTADDQAETVAMRDARGEGPGLAGIAPATLYNGEIWFARPLIGCRRDDLRRWLAARGAAWIDDPSNADPTRERARVRAALAKSGETVRFIEKANAAGKARRALMRTVGVAIDTFAAQPASGLVRFDPELFRDAGRGAESLRLVAAAVGGVARPADMARAAALAGRIAAGERFRATLARCVIDSSAKGVFLHREWRGGGPAAVESAEGAVFDGRFRLAGSPAGGRVEAAGDRAPKGAGRLVDAAARAEPVLAGVGAGAPATVGRTASAAGHSFQGKGFSPLKSPPPLTPPRKGEGDQRPFPSPLWGGVRGGGNVGGRARMNEGDGQLERIVSPYALFLPDFDLSAANALARLLHADEFPASPWPGHNGAIGS